MTVQQSSDKPEQRRWAVLAYIAGDNNLSNAGLEDIQEMCDEGSSKDLHVGVEIDTYGEHTGSVRYEITEPDWTGVGHRTVIERLPEKDCGDPKTLGHFLKWGLERFPADNRLVVIWNHGAGFRSIRRDIGYDDFGSSLDMPEIETAFERAGITKDNKLQIVGFDACLMNMLEIVHHFRDQVEIVVGSQQTEPGDGWPYDKVLRQGKRAETVEGFADGIVSEYINDYRNLGVANVTQSAVRTAETQAVVEAVHELGNLFVQNIGQLRGEIGSIRISAQTFQMADYVDLTHFCELVAMNINNPQIGSAANAVISAVSACVLAKGKFGSAIENANGLSIWFPASPWLYFNYRAKYMELNCNSSAFAWTDFLDAYHGRTSVNL